VVSSDEEARSQFDNASPALVFAAENDRTKQDGYRKKSSQLSHSLRGPLSVILNAAFLLKRKGTKDDVVLEKYLTIIEQQAEAVERMLSDHLRSVF
jgi:signal transduction histidine kinase